MVSPLAALHRGGLLSGTLGLSSAKGISRESLDLADLDPLRYHLAVIGERNRLFQRLTEASVPQVGIFWFTQETGAPPEILASGVPIQLGKAYGIYVDGPDDHDSHWKSITRILPPFLQAFGPNDWPRGRVLFNTVLKQFEVDLSDQLRGPEFSAKIVDYFRLPEAFTAFSYDRHYANTRFTLGPEGPLGLAVQR
jgi:hypothetical protein